MDKLSYALGLGIGRQLAQMGAEQLSIDDFAQAIKDVVAGGQLKLDEAEAQVIVQEFFQKQEEKQRAAAAEMGKKAKEEGYDFFSTVLSISPMKNVNYINEIGEKYSKEYDIPFLFADFKKKNRYLRSVQISKELNMYRQEYCGCVFSKVEKEQRDREKAEKEKQEETKND